MGDKSKIEWTEATWNPTLGCSRVSEGCDRCYAIRESARHPQLPAFEGLVHRPEGSLDWTGRINEVEERLSIPAKWRRPRRVFVDSMSDLFHPDISPEFLRRVWDVMVGCPQHTFQILTKRPQRMAKALGPEGIEFYAKEGPVPFPQPNIWLGTSIESDRFCFRADHLRNTPAKVRFLSLEPLLGPLPSLDLSEIDWVIVGGESGPGARPMHPQWARDIRDQCVEEGVAFLFKQWGSWRPREDLKLGDISSPTGSTPEDFRLNLTRGFTIVEPAWACGLSYEGNCVMQRVPKHEAGRELDGRTWDEYPEAA